MGKRRTPRLIFFLVLTACYFVVELVVGYVAHSLAMVSDAYHMLSDVLALAIALTAVWVAKRPHTESMTFGWARAEIIGALVNGVFLLALCFTILLEAIERFVNPENVKEPKMLMIVGGIGLGINVLGLIFFHDLAHSHDHSHGHSHSHGHKHGSSKKQKKQKSKKDDHKHKHSPEDSPAEEGKQKAPASAPSSIATMSLSEVKHEHKHEHEHKHDDPDHDEHESHDSEDGHGHRAKDKLGMKGVFLHMMGDALGSVAVMIVGFVMWKWPQWWFGKYLDPLLSVLVVGILLFSTIPLVKRTMLLLAHRVPEKVSLPTIAQEMLAIPEVRFIHELHCWQLTEGVTMASCHVVCEPNASQEQLMRVAKDVKDVFHRHEVHATTVQTEVTADDENQALLADNCQITCSTAVCEGKVCCQKRKKNLANLESGEV